MSIGDELNFELQKPCRDCNVFYNSAWAGFALLLIHLYPHFR